MKKIILMLVTVLAADNDDEFKHGCQALAQTAATATAYSPKPRPLALAQPSLIPA